jgi:hypothetical protein
MYLGLGQTIIKVKYKLFLFVKQGKFNTSYYLLLVRSLINIFQEISKLSWKHRELNTTLLSCLLQSLSKVFVIDSWSCSMII